MERLKQYLADEEITQTEFAKRAGVSQPTVWGWLSGEWLPAPETLKKLSAITGLSIDELLDQPRRKAS